MNEKSSVQKSSGLFEEATPDSEEKDAISLSHEQLNSMKQEIASAILDGLRPQLEGITNTIDAQDKVIQGIRQKLEVIEQERDQLLKEIQELRQELHKPVSTEATVISSDEAEEQLAADTEESIDDSVLEQEESSPVDQIRKDPEIRTTHLDHEGTVSDELGSDKEISHEEVDEDTVVSKEVSNEVGSEDDDLSEELLVEKNAVEVFEEKELQAVHPSEAKYITELIGEAGFDVRGEISLDQRDEDEILRDVRRSLRRGKDSPVVNKLQAIGTVTSLGLNKLFSRNKSINEEAKQLRLQRQERNQQIADMDDDELKRYIVKHQEAARYYEKVAEVERQSIGEEAYDIIHERYGVGADGNLAFKDVEYEYFDQKTETLLDGTEVQVRTGEVHKLVLPRDMVIDELQKQINPEEYYGDDMSARSQQSSINAYTDEIAQINAKRSTGFGLLSRDYRVKQAEHLRGLKNGLVRSLGEKLRTENPDMTEEELINRADAYTFASHLHEAYATNRAIEGTATSVVANYLRGNGNIKKALIRQGSIGGLLAGAAAATGAGVVTVATGGATLVGAGVFTGILAAKTGKDYLSASQGSLESVHLESLYAESKQQDADFSELVTKSWDNKIEGRIDDNRRDIGVATATAAVRTGIAGAVGAAAGSIFTTATNAVNHEGVGVTETNDGAHTGDNPDAGDIDSGSFEAEPQTGEVDYAKANYVRYDEQGNADFSYKYNMYAFDEPTPDDVSPEQAMSDQISDGKYNPEQAATMYNLLTHEQRAELGMDGMHENAQGLADRLHDNELRTRYMEMIESNGVTARIETLPDGTYYNYGQEPVYNDEGTVISTRLVYETHNLHDETVTILKGPDGNEEMWLNRCGNKVEPTPPVNVPPVSEVPDTPGIKTGVEKTDSEKADSEKTSPEKTSVEKTDSEKTNPEKTDAEKTDVELTPKDPSEDINVNPDLPEQIKMGDVRVDGGEYQPEDTVTAPPEVYIAPTPEPSPTPAPDATPVAPEVRQEEVEVAPVADGTNGVVDQNVQDDLEESGSGSLETNGQGQPVGNNGRVEG